ncbi:MAG: DUF1002 domain-containing protein [Clostridium sp.]
MKIKKIVTSLALCGVILASQVVPAFADAARVVTLGANLSQSQKQTMLDYFGVKENEVVLLEVNNQEERKYLEGIASEQQIGTKTFSCAFVEPTKKGSGINVKTANITWVTSSMVATTLSTAGITDANCVIASVFPVSGTGALTGIMKAFEDATGENLDEEKKEIASEELIITGDLGNDIGQDKATGVINDIKTEIIKNNTKDTTQIAQTIVNVTNNYNVTISNDQQKEIEELMQKISKQDYNYKDMKKTLNNVKKNVEESLKEAGEKVDKGFFDSIKEWFSGVGDWFTGLFNNDEEDLGILNNTNDSMLGENAKIDATDKEAIKLPSNEEVKGFFGKIWDWFTGLFKSDEPSESGDKVVPETTKPQEDNKENLNKEEPSQNNNENINKEEPSNNNNEDLNKENPSESNNDALQGEKDKQ